MEENKIEATEEESEQAKQIREAAEKMATKVRNVGIIAGAKMICSVVLQTIDKHVNQKAKVSKRDLERCIHEITDFCAVPLKQENEERLSKDLDNLQLEGNDDGTTEG